MSNDECTRPSMGRMAKIGNLYDVRTEKLMLSNIFKTNVDQFVERQDSSSDGLHYDTVYSTKTSEKLQKIGIDANASLSLLCGIMDASGSVNFVKDQKCSERAVECNVIVRKTTKMEHLNYKRSELKEYFEFGGHEHATHVIVGITWGANATITFRKSNDGGHDKKKLTGKMSLELKKLNVLKHAADISAGTNASNDDDSEWADEETKISVHTDVPPADQSLPQNVEDAKKFIDAIVAEKEGKQQTFHLFPIASLVSYLQMESVLPTKCFTISSGRIKAIHGMFDEMDEIYGEMRDYLGDLQNTSSIPKHEVDVFKEHLKDMEIEIDRIKDDIHDLVLKVRKGEENSSAIDEKCASIRDTSVVSRKKFNTFYNEKKDIIERAKFLHGFELKGAQTAADDCRLGEIKRNNVNKNTYILFCSFKELSNNSDRVNIFCKLLMDKKPHDCFIVVETDSWTGPKNVIPQTSTIELYVGGKLIEPDYNLNTRYLKKENFSMESLESCLKKIGMFDTDYTDLSNKTYCHIEIDNFTKETLKFDGYEETRGWFIHSEKTKDVPPGCRYSFVTRKQSMGWYGPAVTCAWKYLNCLIVGCWQIPVAGRGLANNLCFGITKPDITWDKVSYTSIEKILGSEKSDEYAQHAINYYSGAIKSEYFHAVQKLSIKDGIRSETVKSKEIEVKIRMNSGPICHMSIQVFPRNINNYAPELIGHVTE